MWSAPSAPVVAIIVVIGADGPWARLDRIADIGFTPQPRRTTLEEEVVVFVRRIGKPRRQMMLTRAGDAGQELVLAAAPLCI